MTADPAPAPFDPTAIVDTLTETDALTLHRTLARRYGWAGTFYTRDDATGSWQAITDNPDTDMPDFEALLDAPAVRTPKLAALLSEPTVFD